MADIGTDHGFLPISLFCREISPKVIMTDISEPSLKKAIQNSMIHIGPSEKNIDFRAGSGLSVLKPSEVDTVVIAGMGGKLMIDIMAADMSLTCSFNKFILQPRIGQGHLRKWLLDNGFTIIYEDLVKEGRYIPEIITVLSPGRLPCGGQEESETATCADFTGFDMTGKTGDDMIYKIPPWITGASGPVGEFLTRNIETEKKKLENVMLSRERNRQLENKICDDIYYLKKLLEEYENGI